jgi:glucokinase
MNERSVTVGVDIGGTNTVAGIVDQHGTCLLKSSFLTTEQRTAKEFVLRLAATIRELCQNPPLETKLRGIGIAAPAANFHKGIIQNSANLQWKTVDIVEMMKEHFDVPIAVTNDANAAALGEMRFGSTRGMKNFIVITLGTGLGSGIVVDGRLLFGESGVAGELGHVTVDPNGRVCGCKRRGCVEAYVSATGIRRTVFELLAQHTDDTELRHISYHQLTAHKIHELAVQGDPIAMEAFEITGKHLGLLLSNVVAAFDPQAIVLCGGLVKAGDMLLDPTRRSLDKYMLDLNGRKVMILQSKLNDGEAAILGASCLVSDAVPSEDKTSSQM